MKTLKSLIIFGLLLATVSAPARPKAKALARKANKGDLKTDVRFNDAVYRGQYQVPEEALAKVENEKGLSDLLGVRKHFKDRLQESAEQE